MRFQRGSGNGRWIVVAAVAVTLVVFCFNRQAPAEAAYPVEKVKRSFVDKVWSRVKGLARAAETGAENVRLKREVASLAMTMDDCTRLREENARLRSMLDYTGREPGRWTIARVLSEGGGAAAAKKTLRLDKGSRAGVEKGATVAVPEGLVGKIINVTPHTSEALLVTDPALKVSCVVEDSGGAKGVLCGGTGASLALRYFTLGAEVPPRARVWTSGLGGVFPAALAVGTLIEIKTDSSGTVREGAVLPAVDFSSLEDVFIRNEG